MGEHASVTDEKNGGAAPGPFVDDIDRPNGHSAIIGEVEKLAQSDHLVVQAPPELDRDRLFESARMVVWPAELSKLVVIIPLDTPGFARRRDRSRREQQSGKHNREEPGQRHRIHSHEGFQSRRG